MDSILKPRRLKLGEGSFEKIGRFTRHLVEPQRMAILMQPDGRFYFMASRDIDLEDYDRQTGYMILDHTDYSENFNIGHGLYNTEYFDATLVFNIREEQIQRFWDMLAFTFLRDKPQSFYPYSSYFSDEQEHDGFKYVYLHDYIPYSREGRHSLIDRKAQNLVWRFKEGTAGPMVAKLLSMALEREYYILRAARNAVVVPIPASTAAAHETRYREFCSRLAGYIGAEDGYDAVHIVKDREQRKGQREKNALEGLDFRPEVISGKDVLLCDDVFTTGASFGQLANRLMELGARSVRGIILARTTER